MSQSRSGESECDRRQRRGAEKSIHFSPLAGEDQPVSVVPLIVSSLIELNPV